MDIRRGVACRVSTSWVIYHVVELYAHVVDANNAVGNMEPCRGEHGCRGTTSWIHTSMSWIRIMSWTHVVDNSHSSGDVVGPRGVVDPRRGTHVCRGGMSWVTTMSWMYVVGDTLFHEHVVGTDVVCRGY